jgi:alkanesulfonate monooxygenase SsuD/methylene tetrahydromethanopterin reductase-like flavin-dependent oxidoreductase (luciferase family)
MKFGLFFQAQLPKPIDSDDWHEGQELKLFQDTLTQIEFADRLGFDYVWMAEHHYASEYNHMSATDIMLGAAAARTKTIRLGPGVVQMMPGNNHPVKVAENIATLDLISNGRIEFGVGVGTPTEQQIFWPRMTEVIANGQNYDVLWEVLEQTVKMMTSSFYPGYDGEFVNLPAGEIVPKPTQKPHPPLWLAVTSERSLALAAERGMGASCLAQGGPDVVRARVQAYWDIISQRLKPAGLAINPAVCSFTNAMVAATDEKARINAGDGAEFTNYAIHRAHKLSHVKSHINREFVEKQRLEALERAHLLETVGASDLDEQVEEAAMARMGLSAYQTAGGKGGMIPTSPDSPATVIGSPETARKRLMAFEDTGVDVLAITCQVGNRRHEDIMETLEQLGELMPDFKERHELRRDDRSLRNEKLGFPVNSSI